MDYMPYNHLNTGRAAKSPYMEGFPAGGPRAGVSVFCH